jgi:hypothetical protein
MGLAAISPVMNRDCEQGLLYLWVCLHPHLVPACFCARGWDLWLHRGYEGTAGCACQQVPSTLPPFCAVCVPRSQLNLPETHVRCGVQVLRHSCSGSAVDAMVCFGMEVARNLVHALAGSGGWLHMPLGPCKTGRWFTACRLY